MSFLHCPNALSPLRGCLAPLLLAAALVCQHAGGASDAFAAGNAIKVMEGDRVSADVVDLPLTQVLSELSKRVPIEISGRMDGDERLTLHFSRLTLRKALGAIMAGYNYAVVEPQFPGGILLMTVFGKVERKTEEAVAAPAPAPAKPPVQTQAPGAPAPAALLPLPVTDAQLPMGPVPPTMPSETQPSAASRPPDADAAATTPGDVTRATPPGVETAPSDQPEFNPAAWGGVGQRERGHK